MTVVVVTRRYRPTRNMVCKNEIIWIQVEALAVNKCTSRQREKRQRTRICSFQCLEKTKMRWTWICSFKCLKPAKRNVDVELVFYMFGKEKRTWVCIFPCMEKSENEVDLDLLLQMPEKSEERGRCGLGLLNVWKDVKKERTWICFFRCLEKAKNKVMRRGRGCAFF